MSLCEHGKPLRRQVSVDWNHGWWDEGLSVSCIQTVGEVIHQGHDFWVVAQGRKKRPVTIPKGCIIRVRDV